MAISDKRRIKQMNSLYRYYNDINAEDSDDEDGWEEERVFSKLSHLVTEWIKDGGDYKKLYFSRHKGLLRDMIEISDDDYFFNKGGYIKDIYLKM
jgi:hypothetical protein